LSTARFISKKFALKLQCRHIKKSLNNRQFRASPFRGGNPKFWTSIVTALHGMQTWSSDEKSVCPSVKRVDCEKTK